MWRRTSLAASIALAVGACGGGDARAPQDTADAAVVPDATAAEGDAVAADVDAGPSPPAIAVTEGEGLVSVDNGVLALTCESASATCDLALASGEVVVRRAWSEAVYRMADGPELEVRSTGADSATLAVLEGTSSLGPWVAVAIEATTPGAPTLATEVRVYEDQPFVTVDLTVIGTTDEPVEVLVLRPWGVSHLDDGGLFVGAEADDHVVLDNGQLKYLDFVASLHDGGDNTVSNWNAAVVDPETGEGVVAGWLSMERVAPTVVVWNGWHDGIDDPATGRRAFADVTFEATYDVPVVLASGQTFASERAYVDAGTRDPFEALERYAERLRLDRGYELWDGPSPNGWNSWSSSGSTGGYGTSIDEALMLENLAFMVEHLRDYGVRWFQIDDGWQDTTGDWNAHPDRFPHGMQWWAEQVEAEGLLPGIWVQPMSVSDSSALFAEHPEWTVPGPEGPLLDPTQPEVRAHLTALFEKITGEWGYRWVKVDFAYQLLLASGYQDATKTPEEVYRAGMQAIAEGLDDDVFFLSVAAPGLNYDISHANRITLDVMPWWDEGLVPAGQGFANIARTIARRWYMHGRAQITHPDLLVFREEGVGGTPNDQPNPPRPLHESICFSTLVAMSGGIVKIGDRMAIDLGPEQIDVIRRVLPSYDVSGRPLDVFERTTPELWALPVAAPWESWTVVSLFHWGLNGPGWTITDTEETSRHHVVPLERLGLAPDAAYLGFEYWSETSLGLVQGTLEVDVEPRHVATVSLRELRDGEVQLVATNRHVTMGATDVEAVAWDAAAGALEGTQPAAPGWPYRLWFHVPDGLEVTAALVDGAPATWEQPAAGDERMGRLSFERAELGTVTWRVETASP